ncbi:MAG TPA: DNA-3-methyladenine glycosylase [Pirellulaceae bacterium]|nr:DNA-3-methyladenine glycosylase [Pirellulaceae bacterium]HMO93916.1 DNA-3-methyladenine glycosylase [Pirellulaceae bacterium]HMP68954.1 DNA-3-methyladenine glycosylase [Pirellulaceae bacterium]
MPYPAQTLKSARHHLLKSDKIMRSIVKRVGPCQITTKRDRFVALAASIVSQQISGAAARTVWGRLESALLPDPVSPEAVARFSIERLRDVGISRQKATYLLDLSEKCLNGDIELNKIARLENEGVIENLTRVKGIGRWTAQMFLMFSLCREDVLPVDDLGIKTAIKTEYELSELPNSKQIESIAQPWRPYATIACWYLWRSLENR